MKIEHIECQVICDGQVLTEYQEKDDGQRAKTCHIISEAGKVTLNISLSFIFYSLVLVSYLYYSASSYERRVTRMSLMLPATCGLTETVYIKQHSDIPESLR